MYIHHRQSTFNAASGITLKQTPVSQVCNHKSINLHHIQYMNLDCFELYRLIYILLCTMIFRVSCARYQYTGMLLACTPGSGCVTCIVIHSHLVYIVRWEASGLL